MTQAQDEARKQNAQRSTGPKSEEGKKVSSMNSLKHGLYAQIEEPQDIPCQGDDHYQQLLDSLTQHFNPQNPLEEILIERIALLQWRLKRIAMAERKAMHATPGMEHPLPPAGALERILRYERTMDRELHRSIAHLKRLQSGAQSKTRDIETDLME